MYRDMSLTPGQTLICTDPHWQLLKSWSVHQHHCGMLQAIAALKFAQGATIDDKRFALLAEYQHQLASLSKATDLVPLFVIPTG